MIYLLDGIVGICNTTHFKITMKYMTYFLKSYTKYMSCMLYSYARQHEMVDVQFYV